MRLKRSLIGLILLALYILALTLTGCSDNSGANNSGNNDVTNDVDTQDELAYTDLDAILQAIVNDTERPLSGLAVIALKNGAIEYQGNFGFRYIDNENPENNLPVDENSKFRIASISKMVTAIGFLQQVENGTIDIDADVSEYLGFTLRNPAFPDIPITSRMLLTHTSSVRDGGEYGVYAIPPDYSLDEFFKPAGIYGEKGEYWGTADEKPGVYLKYANLNYGILATILENVTGTRFDVYMKENVFDPMGIDASFNVGHFSEQSIADLSVLYRKRNDNGWDPAGPWIPQVDDFRGIKQDPDTAMVSNPDADQETEMVNIKDYRVGTNATIFSPQGGLRISATDLAKIMQMLINDGKSENAQLLSKATVEEMFNPGWSYDPDQENGDNYWGLLTAYGFGTWILQSVDADRILDDRDIVMAGHLGEAYGLLSSFMVDRETGDGFICLIGGIGSDPNDYFGEYSAFYMWEERIMTALFDNIFPAE